MPLLVNKKLSVSMCTNLKAANLKRNNSLPCIKLDNSPTLTRQRCNTLPTVSWLSSHFGTVQAAKSNLQKVTPETECSSSILPASVCSPIELDMLPSTSVCNKTRMCTDSQISSRLGGSTTSLGSSTKTKPIQIIDCDSIKIWTDQSLKQSESAADQIHRHNKFNSFFAHLFGSSPTYTSWSFNYTWGRGNYCDNLDGQCTESFPVFDKFLPVSGRKLRKSNANNLFQDGVSMLDYSTPLFTSENKNTNNNEDLATVELLDAMVDKAGVVLSIANNAEIELVPLSSSEIKRQYLTTLLQMSRFSRNNTDIENENAHFCISEACISAIEHYKWTRQKEQLESASSASSAWSNENKEEASECQLNSVNACRNAFSPDVIDLHDAELRSAESVGLTLISRINGQQQSNINDVTWLVAEKDTPQKMLPMPANFVAKQQSQSLNEFRLPPMTRGTKFWAPPRQQIIFTDHPLPNRLDSLHKQNYLCAGCGMHVAKQYIHLFRYCTYLGKYFCTGCHRNQMALIPAKILQSWDFNCFPVSAFAYRLVDQMYSFPMFYVPDLNRELYDKFTELKMARCSRMQLKFVRDLIRHCRFAIREQGYFQGIPDHIICEPDVWSMSDFVDVHNKSMRRSIDELIELCETHAYACVLCTGRGFICEYCRMDQVLYLWQKNTHRCADCGACFHLNCWKSMSKICHRCIRIEKRQYDKSTKS